MMMTRLAMERGQAPSLSRAREPVLVERTHTQEEDMIASEADRSGEVLLSPLLEGQEQEPVSSTVPA